MTQQQLRTFFTNTTPTAKLTVGNWIIDEWQAAMMVLPSYGNTLLCVEISIDGLAVASVQWHNGQDETMAEPLRHMRDDEMDVEPSLRRYIC